MEFGFSKVQHLVECNGGRWQRIVQVLEKILHIKDENNGNSYFSLFLGIFKFKIDYNFDSLIQ